MDPLLNPFDYFTVPFGDWAEASLDRFVSFARPTLVAAKMPVQSFLEFVQRALLAMPPSLGIIGLVILGFLLSGWRLALTGFFCLTMIGLMGAWSAAMTTLSIVIAAVVICVVIGLPLGILAGAQRPVLPGAEADPGPHAVHSLLRLSGACRHAVLALGIRRASS